MYYIVIQACLINAGYLCLVEEKPINQVTIISGNPCIQAAPMVISTWLDTHPEWEIKKWKCTNGR